MSEENIDAGGAVPLKHPVEHEGATYTALRLRRMVTGDLIEMEEYEGGEMRKAVLLISLLAGIPFEVAKKIDAEDFAGLSARLGKLREALAPGKDSAGSRPSP